jgi:tripartite-type tricarboxylate transporter receptor subunit TctC
MMGRCSILIIWLVALGFVANCTSVRAQQNYPSGPVTFVVPLPPGGTVDILARSVSERLQTYTGQPFLVENVTGGATSIAAERVARAPADGYTLLVATSTTLSSNPYFFRNLRYKISDFQPISLLSQNEFVVHIRRTLSASNLKELIAYAAETPNGITYATVGRGSTSEVLGELMKATFKVEMRDVPYRGSPPALMDVMKGVVDMDFDNITSTIPYLGSGQTKIIATTGEARSALMPDIPTLAELGYPGMSMENIFAILAPKGTPRPIVDKLNVLVHRALAEPQLIERWTAEGAPPRPTTPEGLAAVMARNRAFYEKNIRELKLPPID